jgi:glutamate--cysteine ligase
LPAPSPTLTADQVRRFVRDHCFRPTPPSRTGVELEWLVVDPRHPDRPVPFPRVEQALAAALPLPGGSRVTYEPGGQLELSTPPATTLGAACAAADADVTAARAALQPLGLDLVGLGLDPLRTVRRVVDAPRYRAMEAYFDTQGDDGHRMMCETAAIQVNVDVGQPDELADRWRLALALAPLLAAAFAHSPFANGAPTGLRSTRLATWVAIDPTRTMPPADTPDPVDAWARYALSARVMLVRVDAASYVAVTRPLTFAGWIAGGHDTGWPTLDDFEYHLTTLFPPVRPRGWLELRTVDALPHPWWRVPVAVAAALLDDPGAAPAAYAAAAPVAHAWDDAVHGLAAPAFARAARTCFALALDALPRLAADAATLDLVAAYQARYVERGRTPADDLLDSWARTGSFLPPAAPLEAAWT